MNFWNTFYKLCQERGKSPNGVAKEIGIPSGTITWWKKGKIPHNEKLQKLANYFDVSVGQLLGYEAPHTKVINLNKEQAQELTAKLIGEKVGQLPHIRHTGVKRIAYITENEKAPTLSEGEKALIELFRQLPPEKQELVAQTVKAFADSLK